MAGFSSLFICQMLVYLIHATALYLRPLVRFIFNNIFWFRLEARDCGVLNKDDTTKVNFHESEPEAATACGDFGAQSEEEDEPEETYLKFNFPSFEEFSKTQKEICSHNIGNTNFLHSGVVAPPAHTREFELTSVDETEKPPVQAVEIDADEYTDGNSEEDFRQTLGAHDRGEEILVVDENENKKTEVGIEFQDINAQTVISENQSSDKTSIATDSDSDAMSFNHTHVNHFVNPLFDGFLSDADFGSELNSDLSSFEETQHSPDEFSDEDSDMLEELENLQKDKASAFLSIQDFEEKIETDHDKGSAIVSENMEKSSLEDSSDDPNELESLWEHQELIEQLKLELKKVRATGLPTILEDCESPKLMDDLKPWKMDEFQRERCSGGLHRFYKSYRERMRKFDIINYQKMYAMGFLQLKDPLKPIPAEKPSPPTLKSLVSQNLWSFKHKIHGSDPTRKLVEELRGDLEAVYVGQLCLSWEFLHWQYDKVVSLWESDPRRTGAYNEVSGEFQQFQVLAQRFLEDEPFQGQTRVMNYVKARCAVRNLLQVPIAREDNMKDKRKAEAKTADDYVVTSEVLVETIEESIRIFWRFLRSDKDCSIASLNCRKKTPELPSLEHLGLWMDVKKAFQKKDRKMKEMLRRENCILRRFRQCRDDDELDDQVLYFFSQVDMRLVCRVLNMSKVTRDQLVWCRNKLDRTRFENGRIRVEPSFLLFPC